MYISKEKTNRSAVSQYQRYLKSNARTLNDVYTNCSCYKTTAFNECVSEMERIGGHDIRIVSANSQQFSVGFLTDRDFIFITKTYARAYSLKEINERIEYMTPFSSK